MLAGPGVVAATYATGALANWLLMPTADGRYFNSSSSGGGSVDIVGLPGEALADGCAADAWTEMAGYVLGVIVSATDPVAVVALLKELGVKAELSIGIEGESLLNDGSALVAFTLLVKTIKHAQCATEGALCPDGSIYVTAEHWDRCARRRRRRPARRRRPREAPRPSARSRRAAHCRPELVVWTFLNMAVFGGLFGLVMGVICARWISRVFNDALIEIT